MGQKRIRGFAGLQQAFDEARFGAERTLNLRASFPTASEAAHRLEIWLRQHQVQRSAEVLVITGRGNNSDDGVSVVRETSMRVFHELRRKNIIAEFAEHTPGSFVVRPAPVAAMFDAAKRRREHGPVPPPVTPPTLAALAPQTSDMLRVLAERSLDALGVKERGAFVEEEMLRLFGVLGATVLEGPERERQLRHAIAAAMDDYD